MASNKIGFFSIGLNTYWPQFPGLQDRLLGYHNLVVEKLKLYDCSIADAGMVDDIDKSSKAREFFRSENVSAIFLYISTYALSSTVLPVVQNIGVPVMVLNLQPVKAIDYEKFNSLGDRGIMTGEWLAHCQSCAVPEIASVFNRASIKFRLISGYLDEEYVWNDIREWMQALKVVKSMQNNRVGVLGHYYNGMLDVYSDLTQQAACFGNHFEILEFGSLKQLHENVSGKEVEQKIHQFKREFEVSPECSRDELLRAARTSVATDKLVKLYQLGSLAFYYEGAGDAGYENIVTSLIPGFTLLTGSNVPVAGECEVKNVQAMKIMDILGCGGSFSEFYAIDFNDEIIIMGHDGPAHFKMAEGKVGLVPLPLYHGKPGKGLSIQMKVKNGPVTLLSVCQDKQGRIYLLVAEGESVEGPTLKIGTTNSRYKFNLTARDFIDKWSLAGPSHHCAIGTGNVASLIKKIAGLLDIECIQVC
jgi:L-arabinose isomerase